VRRNAISVVGKRSSEDAPSTAKVTISSVARSLFELAACIFSMADNASGVAALPIPKMFADSAAQISSLP